MLFHHIEISLKLSNLLQEMDVEEGASKDVHFLGKSIVC
jgi:hypothetical protein